MAANEEASPICRGKNLSWETVMLFFNYMPKEPMPKDKFNSFVEDNINSWTQTHSQIARQLAFYYEEDGICYPRFNEASTLEDLFSYMIHWAHNYFVPNPFAPSLKGKTPTCIYSHLVKCIENGMTDFDEALDSLFDVPLSSHDKVRVYLQNYSNIKFDQGIISLNENIVDNSKIIDPTEDAATNPKLYFLFFGKEDSHESVKEKKIFNKQTLQQIFYGAPGTGKSHTINEQTEGESVIRTTFHPDSDYSTFVGAYKPTMGLLPICDELGQPMKIGSSVLHKEQIIYEFVDQAFLQAYVNAWKYYADNSEEIKKQYLIIEEINRGNCAQIFGDLFQLLDRNDYGFSVYPINADKDMKKHLEKAFKGVRIDNADSINQHYKGRNVVKEVLDGDILLLPNNLYIWATMNTSDQSLFPIDSAFKRRWEWQYMPIGKGYDENGQEIKWAIEGATQKYDWWSFLEKINAQVGEATQSEDKKLGFFFCKATDGVISAEKFVGKVIFYLWNDVFKNNGFDGPKFQDADKTELSFGKFYRSDMKGNAIVQKDKVELFLNNLGVEVVGSTDPEDEDENEQNDDSNKSQHVYLKSVTFDDEVFSSDELSKFEVYIMSLQKIGLDRVVPIIEQSKYKRMNCPLVSKQQYDAIIESKPYSYVEIDGYQFVKGAADETLINVLNEIKDALNLSFSIQTYKK